MMDPKQVEQVTDKLAHEDKEQRYNEAVAAWAIAGSGAIWIAFLLWDDFRAKLMKEGLWWLPIAATFMIALAGLIVSKKADDSSSG